MEADSQTQILTDGLLAMLVFQYAPYEAGAGKVFWVKDRLGLDVPVITARYSNGQTKPAGQQTYAEVFANTLVQLANHD